MAPKALPSTLNPSNVAPPKPTYSPLSVFTVHRTNFITIPGQIGTFADGSLPPTFGEQVSCALQNVKNCLAAAGATPRDIIKNTQYIVGFDPKDTKRSELWLDFVGEHRPPGTLVPLETLGAPGLLFETEVMAVLEVDEQG